jgi:hypothetical protein
MAVWKIDIEKSFQGETWTNVYYVEADTLQDAADIGDAIVPIEESITSAGVLFTKYRTSDLVPNTDNFITSVINEFGDRAIDTVTLMPLFVVARCDLSVGVGRPGRKYLRGVLYEQDVRFGAIETTAVTLINDNYTVPLAEVTGLCLEDGTPVLEVTLNPVPGMRQLRRGSKRKATPVIP